MHNFPKYASRCFSTGETARLILPDGKEATLPLLNGTTGTDKFMDIQTLYKQVCFVENMKLAGFT